MTDIRVRVADAAVEQGDVTISTIGLGSCVAIVLHDADRRVGGLAHILLPSETLSQDRSNRAKFPATAVPLLLERMRAMGANRARIVAKLAGGASMFANLLPTSGLQMGERNLIAARAALAQASIPVVAEDVGGGHGRNVFFRVASGEVEVRSMVRGNVVI
ncbi:MAG TPA: chemotaxis protein CheD [Gemmatimonadaceae bacterium]|jgi:Chemotaxis protein; stimulates methylation of MCP proteins